MDFMGLMIGGLIFCYVFFPHEGGEILAKFHHAYKVKMEELKGEENE